LCRNHFTLLLKFYFALRRIGDKVANKDFPKRNTQVDLREYLQNVEIRPLLEPFATQRAAGRVSVAALEALEQRLHALNRAAPTLNDFAALHPIDNDIHSRFVSALGSMTQIAAGNL
jgi:DNA-binding FadR family transcriptional regulator